MTTFKGPQGSRAIHASSESGNAWADDNRVTPNAALTTNDEVVVMTVPAGTRLTGMRYRNGDFDTGATLAVSIGYRSKHATPLLAASTNYFLNASTALQAAQATWQELVFDEITFNEPVDIVLKPTVSAAGVAGTPTFFAQARGVVVGVT